MNSVSAVTGLERLMNAPGLKGKPVRVLSNGGLNGFLQEKIQNQHDELHEPFYVLDLGVVESLHRLWKAKLPMVQPFYAVKCNTEPALLGALASLGSGFDCASRAEIESVLALGVSPARIVYSNPCKSVPYIKYAASVGVNLTAFDSLEELKKIQKWHPGMELLIRIKPPEDSHAKNPLDAKFGALPEEVEPLLQAAQAARLAIVGVSFHIGSGATKWSAFRAAIAMAKNVFESAVQLGLPPMGVLNIGGGFRAGPEFSAAANTITTALRDYFSDKQRPTIMAEPGRYFSETAFTLAACVIGKRTRGKQREYWINDGAYGSLNCIINDHAVLKCEPLACTSNPENPTCQGAKTHVSKVFGPTLDAADTVVTGQMLPELEINDWLVFRNRGAYSVSCGTSFNGFDTAAMSVYPVYSTPN